MNRFKSILWGVVLVAIGVLVGLDVLNVIDFTIFFEGWWTLFIIVPSVIGLITDRDKTWSIIGIVVGAVLLLACQDIIEDGAVFKLILPFIIVLIGLKMIFKDFFNKDVNAAKKKINSNGEPTREYAAIFSGQNVDLSGEVFNSVEVNAVFGGMKCDLRNAVITDGAVLNISSIFGGIDILVPPDVNVKISTNSVFGGVSDKRQTKPVNGAVTLYVTGNCIFGGADIK